MRVNYTYALAQTHLLDAYNKNTAAREYISSMYIYSLEWPKVKLKTSSRHATHESEAKIQRAEGIKQEAVCPVPRAASATVLLANGRLFPLR
jgi:hypothetical protein